MNRKNEYDNLLCRYAKLLFEKNKLIIRDGPYIEARYLFYFGDLMIEELSHNKTLKELKIKQRIYENYFGLKRDKEIKKIGDEINRHTELLSKQINELERKCNNSKDILKLRKENEQNINSIDELFFDVILKVHPFIYDLKNDTLWERAKNAYLNYDEGTLILLKNLNIKKSKKLDINTLESEIFSLQNEIICMKKKYPYYLEKNLSSDSWINSYDKEINERIKKLQFEEKQIFEKLV